MQNNGKKCCKQSEGKHFRLQSGVWHLHQWRLKCKCARADSFTRSWLKKMNWNQELLSPTKWLYRCSFMLLFLLLICCICNTLWEDLKFRFVRQKVSSLTEMLKELLTELEWKMMRKNYSESTVIWNDSLVRILPRKHDMDFDIANFVNL